MEQSIWKETDKGDWKLFFNTDIKPPLETEKKHPPKLSHASSNINKTKGFTLGTLFITSKGIGRLIKLEDTSATIRLSQSNLEEVFNINEISNTLNIFIKRYDNNFINWYRITLPVNGNIELVREEIEKMKMLDSSFYNYFLIGNGNELKEEYSFEQLDFKQNNKVLIVKEKISSNTIKRYKNIYEWWYGFNNDGISFSCNKKIRLTGIGLYRSHENKIQNGDVVVCEECSPDIHLSEVLHIEIPPIKNKDEAVFPVMFSKPLMIKPGIIYMVEFKCTNPCSMYYGAQGQKEISGEKKVEFTFILSPREFRHGTNVQSGNFPEFYYYA